MKYTKACNTKKTLKTKTFLSNYFCLLLILSASKHFVNFLMTVRMLQRIFGYSSIFLHGQVTLMQSPSSFKDIAIYIISRIMVTKLYSRLQPKLSFELSAHLNRLPEARPHRAENVFLLLTPQRKYKFSFTCLANQNFNNFVIMFAVLILLCTACIRLTKSYLIFGLLQCLRDTRYCWSENMSLKSRFTWKAFGWH